MECFTLYKLIGIGKESLISNGDTISTFHKHRTNADKACHTALLTEVVDFVIQLEITFSTLLYVAQYDCALTALMVWTPVHEIECDIK